MPHDIPVTVALDTQILHTVDCRAAVVATHDRIVAHVRLSHPADHMEVNRVLAEQEGLPNIIEL